MQSNDNLRLILSKLDKDATLCVFKNRKSTIAFKIILLLW
jgi:hypothetical protein